MTSQEAIYNLCSLAAAFIALTSAGESNPTAQKSISKHDQPLRTLHQSNDVLDVAFSSDGRFLATLDDDNLVRLWDIKTWKVQKTFRSGGDSDETTAIAMDVMLPFHLMESGLWVELMTRTFMCGS